MADALATLRAINDLLETATPLIGAAMTFGRRIVEDVAARGENVGDFATEIARFDAVVAAALDADAAWRARHGLPPAD